LPRFDKSTDDRMPLPGHWQGPAPDIVFLEGWCIGCPGGHGLRQAPPVNALERQQDPDGQWWNRVCENVVRYEQRLGRLLDQRWLMLPPDWAAVVNWRWAQEQELGERARLSDRQAVRSFLATFERLGRHIMETGDRWADRVIRLDAAHHPRVDHRP
jgi:D-glycerate 3-kinase